jgi:hypothetical protein
MVYVHPCFVARQPSEINRSVRYLQHHRVAQRHMKSQVCKAHLPNELTEVLPQMVSLLAGIREAPSSNLGLNTDHSDIFFVVSAVAFRQISSIYITHYVCHFLPNYRRTIRRRKSRLLLSSFGELQTNSSEVRRRMCGYDVGGGGRGVFQRPSASDA